MVQYDSGRMNLEPVVIFSSFWNCWGKASGLVLRDPGRQERVKLNQVKNKAGLTGAQSLGSPDILEEWLFSPLQPVSPLFKG